MLVTAAIVAKAGYDVPACALQAQEFRPQRLLGVDVAQGDGLSAQKERPPMGERSGIEGMGEGPPGLAHA